MDNLPLGPMLAVIALLVLWAALFTAIEAAQQHLLALRPGTRQGDKAAARRTASPRSVGRKGCSV